MTQQTEHLYNVMDTTTLLVFMNDVVFSAIHQTCVIPQDMEHIVHKPRMWWWRPSTSLWLIWWRPSASLWLIWSRISFEGNTFKVDPRFADISCWPRSNTTRWHSCGDTLSCHSLLPLCHHSRNLPWSKSMFCRYNSSSNVMSPSEKFAFCSHFTLHAGVSAIVIRISREVTMDNVNGVISAFHSLFTTAT